MSFIGKLFGKSRGDSNPPLLTPPPASPPPPGAPKMMKVWDEYGRISEISREDWRTQVLPLNFRSTWNKPDDLANLISNALYDGFIADCLEPARQLYRIDTQPLRAANYLVVILLQLKKFDEAEKIACEALKRHGEEGSLLTNLAKAYSGKGDKALVDRTLWRALEVDPNQHNGLLWFEAIEREQNGKDAGLEAFRRVAALPASWRAQLWLARAALASRQLDQALALYRESLSRAGKPTPTDLLQQMSGDLGNAAHLPELLQLAEPCFDPKVHGLAVGNNLIKAHLDLGQFDASRKILDRLYAQKRPDWKEHLAYWDTELAKARIALTSRETPQAPQVSMLTIQGPVWLKPDSPAAELFPAHPVDSPIVTILGCAAEAATNSKRIEPQMSDTSGRMSRALPLFLAEQIEFTTRARARTLVPWIVADSAGFVLSGGPWGDDNAASYARQADAKSDYVVTILIRPIAEPWTVELRLVRTIDAKCLWTTTSSFPSAKPEQGIPGLTGQLISALAQHAEIESLPIPTIYQVPDGVLFGNYLLRLEQLLAVRCSTMDDVQKGFLNGEREIIDGNLQLSLYVPQNACTRILLAQTALTMNRVRPDVVAEFKDRLARLQREKPLSEPAHAVVQRLFKDVLVT